MELYSTTAHKLYFYHNENSLYNYPSSSSRLHDEGEGNLEVLQDGNNTGSPNNRFFKTRICALYSRNPRDCIFGDKCQFAHGLTDLRYVLPERNYKREICKSYHYFGECIYGKRCSLIHNESLEKLKLIDVQRQLFEVYQRSHPEARDALVTELLELQDSRVEILKELLSQVYFI
ncbi:unnamed protein product [Trichobilharzia regenti]|nr:unnamed protein product [Trichobilharzia regenti]